MKTLTTYFNLKRLGGEVEVCRSADGGGYHIIAYGLPISFKTSLMLRKMLGDDPSRIKFDEDSYRLSLGKPLQILYTKKGEKPIERMDEGNLLCLPLYSKVTRSRYRSSGKNRLRF